MPREAFPWLGSVKPAVERGKMQRLRALERQIDNAPSERMPIFIVQQPRFRSRPGKRSDR